MDTYIDKKIRTYKRIFITALTASLVLVISSVSYLIDFKRSDMVEIASVITEKTIPSDDSQEETPMVTDKELIVQYEPINLPNNADINIVSDNVNETPIYMASNVDLSQRLSYSFTTQLANQVYALIISSPNINTKVVPFLSNKNQIIVDVGSFELISEQNT